MTQLCTMYVCIIIIIAIRTRMQTKHTSLETDVHFSMLKYVERLNIVFKVLYTLSNDAIFMTC